MSAPDATNKVRGVLESIAMPEDEIIFAHVRLKDFCLGESYQRLARRLLEEINDLYRPKTILVPTFTYGFTDTGFYDRRNTPSEVGRFGEEIRQMHSFRLRTMNPVFSVVDTNGYFTLCRIDETTAFGPDSLMEILSTRNYVILNINLPELVSTHFHYLEYIHNVDYRFEKTFPGVVSSDGRDAQEIQYRYFVRDLDRDTCWRRDKVQRFLTGEEVLSLSEYDDIHSSWMYSRELESHLGAKLDENPQFMITDESSVSSNFQKRVSS